MEGLPADEPDLPPAGASVREAAPTESILPGTAPVDVGVTGLPPVDGFDRENDQQPASPTRPPLPPGPHLEVEELQMRPTRALKTFAAKEYDI